MAPRSSAQARRGLTLIELAVTLAILATVVGVAVATSDKLLEQARYEATSATLESIEVGVLGQGELELQPGRAWLRGFVNDIGRLPQVTELSGPLMLPVVTELWERRILPAVTLQKAAGDTDVRLVAGWRGPYVRLPFAEPVLRDGWGKTFIPLREDGTVAPVGDEVAQFATLGADGMSGGGGYDEDRAVVVASTALGARHRGVVPVRVTFENPPTAGFIVLRLYGPENGAVQTLAEKFVDVSTLTGDFPWVFTEVSIGHRALRAYLTDVSPASEEADLLSGSTSRSAIVPIAVVQGGVPEILVEMP